MRPFVRDEGPGYVAHLEAPERAVLIEVVDSVIDLVGDGQAAVEPPPDAAVDPEIGPDVWQGLAVPQGPVEAPRDPALRRLLPDASLDPDQAAELRRLTEGTVRGTKIAQLRRLRAAVDAARPHLVVVPSEAPSCAAAMTDLRLVLAERLGLRTDEDAEEVYALAVATSRPVDDVDANRRFVAAVYAVLTDLQESLVQAMVAELPPPRRGRGLGSARE